MGKMKMKKGLVLRHIGEEHIIIEPDKGMVDMTRVYTLNDTAAWLWEQIYQMEFTPEQMENLLMQQYEIDQECARKDVLAVIEQFMKQGLIEE